MMLYAYTDQAPAWLRNVAFQIDAAFGYPVLALIRAIAGYNGRNFSLRRNLRLPTFSRE